jgi:molybdopterin synthase sulfur carrier subunit
MRWQLFATLAETAEDNEVDVPVKEPEPTLRDAFDALLAAHPDLESQVLAEDGSLQEHIRLLCDGEDPFHAADGWETDVSDAEELALFPPVTGG